MTPRGNGLVHVITDLLENIVSFNQYLCKKKKFQILELFLLSVLLCDCEA